ncbi:phenylalanyl-tRNA synthetase alpha chain [Streptacidiphilus sp. MAP12-20]|uniref:tRNA ligase subunit PheS family protein n=1 Tax=Streptacidiphilus sp. MAP12-20 TaxID=3156299 RepID=UPI0035186CE9
MPASAEPTFLDQPLTEELLACLRDRALAELVASPPDRPLLDAWERRHLGPRAPLRRCRAALGSVSVGQRPGLGRLLAAVTAELASVLERHRDRLQVEQGQRPPAPVDFGALPDADGPRGSGEHPVPALAEQIARYFLRQGFTRHDSRQLEDVAHSFDLLGVPADHPTRSPQHSYFTTGGAVLRGHTTASVLRILREQGADGPRRILVSGPCHRHTVPNARFVTQFHQSEALALGPTVRLGDVKGLALGLLGEVLGEAVRPRLRFRQLPYVSPGLAVDVECLPCASAGCELCQGSGRLEVVSGGLLTRTVLDAAGVPPALHALSLAISLERVLAIRHRLGDIRYFLGNDPRILGRIG